MSFRTNQESCHLDIGNQRYENLKLSYVCRCTLKQTKRASTRPQLICVGFTIPMQVDGRSTAYKIEFDVFYRKTWPASPVFYALFVISSIRVACSLSSLIGLMLGGSLCIVMGLGIGYVSHWVIKLVLIAKLVACVISLCRVV